jgi:molecular chaperone GrpE
VVSRNNEHSHQDPDSSDPETLGAADQSLGDDASSEMEQLRADLHEATDRVLRAQADLENYRKRARREMEEERRYAFMPLLRDLLPVVDNLQRALAASEKAPDSSGLLDGVRMVASSLEATLARHHCKKVDALNQPFDPAVHEAIAQQPSPGLPPYTVVAVAQDGYLLHDRVVRPAQVVVSVAPSE